MNVYCLLYGDYETLDLMGPVEMLARVPDVALHYVSREGGLVASRQGFAVATQALQTLPEDGVLLVPGGQGTRALVHDEAFLQWLGARVDEAETCLAVCTGSALLAACGRLDGLRATSNKKAFAWVRSVSAQVEWQAVARWVRDGKFYTSSGVSAGMDMALGFVADRYGRALAEEIVVHAEYAWQDDAGHDPFARIYGYH